MLFYCCDHDIVNCYFFLNICVLYKTLSEVPGTSKTLHPDVARWLIDLGLQSVETYKDVFADNEMDMETVRLVNNCPVDCPTQMALWYLL